MLDLLYLYYMATESPLESQRHLHQHRRLRNGQTSWPRYSGLQVLQGASELHPEQQEQALSTLAGEAESHLEVDAHSVVRDD